MFDFLSNDGYKIVCGGTTSKIVANYLGEELKMELESKDKDVPPIGYIKGIDLVSVPEVSDIYDVLVNKINQFAQAVNDDATISYGTIGKEWVNWAKVGTVL